MGGSIRKLHNWKFHGLYPHPICLSNKIEENVIGRACAIYGELWWGNVKGGEHFEDLGTNRRKYEFLRIRLRASTGPIHMDKVNMRAL